MKQQKAKEALRLAPRSSREIDFEIRKLDEEAEKASELGLNIEDVRALDKLKPNLLLDEQKIGWHALETITINLLTRLKKKNARLNLTKIRPDNIRGIVSKSKIRTNKAEKLAMRKINELMNQSGVTADHLRNDWSEMFVEPAISATQGWTEKLGKAWDRDPWGTAGLMVAGAAGVYIGYRAIKGVWGWITGKGKEAEGAGKKEGFLGKLMPKGALGPLTIMAAGLFLGRGELKRLIYAKLGLKLDDEKLDEFKEAAQEGKDALQKKIDEERKKLGETTEAIKQDKVGRFDGAAAVFVNMNFIGEREYGGGSVKNNLVIALKQIKETELSTIKNIFTKYEKKEEIPKNEFPKIKVKVEEGHLYLLIKNLLDLHHRLKKVPRTADVETLFLYLSDDPLHKMNNAFHEKIMDKINNGEGIEGIAKIKFDEIDNEFHRNKDHFLDTIKENIKLDLTGLDDVQEKALKRVQVNLLLFNIDQTPADAIETATRGITTDTIVIKKATEFYEKIQSKTLALIDPCVERFEIVDKKGGQEALIGPEFAPDRIKFSSAIQLVLAAEGMNWNELDPKETNWMKDMVMLRIILKTLKPKARNNYIGRLAFKIAGAFEEEATDFKIPAGLIALTPYLKKIGVHTKNWVLGWMLNTMEPFSDLKGQVPTERGNIAELIRRRPLHTLSSEAGGDALQISTEFMAFCLSFWGKDVLGKTKTAEEFIEFITKKGAKAAYDMDNPTDMAIELFGKYTITKPLGILKQSLKQADIGDAISVWAVGSAPFAIIGAGMGLKRPVHQAGIVSKRLINMLFGFGKGMAYPIYAPWWVAKKGLTAGKLALEYGKRPIHYVGWLGRKAKDVGYLAKQIAKTKSLTGHWRGKSFIEVLINGDELFKHYAKSKYFREEMTVTERLKEPFTRPRQFLSRATFQDINGRLAVRDAKKFAKGYNNLMKFDKLTGRLSYKDISSIDEIKDAATKLKYFVESVTNPSSAHFAKIRGLIRSKGLKKAELVVKIEEILTETGLDIHQRKAIARQLTSEKKLNAFVSKIKDGGKYLRNSWRGRLATLVAKVRGAGITEKLITKLAKADNADDVIKILRKKGIKIDAMFAKDIAGTKNTDMIRYYLEELEEIGETGRTEGRLAKLRKGIGRKAGKAAGEAKEYAARGSEKLKALLRPKLTEAYISKLVKSNDAAEIQKLLKQKGLKAESEIAERMAKAGNIDDVKYIIREVAKENNKIVKFIARVAKVGKVLKFAKPAVPITFGAAAFVGAGMDYYQALSTENKEKQKLYFEKGHFGTVAGGIEAGAMIGYGAFSGAAAWAAAATAPYLYMTDTAYESALEAETTSEEWAQRCDHETLIHHWISTGKGGLTAGEAYRMVLPMMTFERIRREHKETRWKIADAIVLQEGDRFENETTLRQIYLAKRNYSIPTNYEMARNQLHRSKLYAEIIHARSVAMANPPQEKYPKIGEFDILNPKFSPAKMSFPDTEKMINIYEKEAFEQNVHPLLAKNFKNLSTGELLDYYMKVDKYLSDKRNEITENEIYFRDQLKHYLMFNRQTDAIRATRSNYIKTIRTMIIAEKGELPDDIKELQAAEKKALKKIKADYKKSEVLSMMEFFETGQKELEVKNEKITDNEACYALYKLARFFGYIGLQNEEHLKAFFDEDHKTAFAIYWDGDEWTVNEAGWEWDNDVGDDLTLQTVKNMIKELRSDPENILEHRQEALVMSTSEIFKTQVLHMADILENSLNNYEKQKKAPQLPLAPQKEPAKEEINEEALVS